jgi:hypothetical protein
MNLTIVVLVSVIILVNVSQIGKVTAETGIGNDVFNVSVTLFGITNSTKDITTIVNVKDQTKVKIFNAENPEEIDNATKSYVMTFPNMEVNAGEPYMVSTASIEDFELNCIEGNNSPVNRSEFVDINLSDGTSGVEGQDENTGDQDANEDEGD